MKQTHLPWGACAGGLILPNIIVRDTLNFLDERDLLRPYRALSLCLGYIDTST
jgi:hypothetical protein